MQSKSSVSSNWELDFSKIISKILARRDSEPFREPVNWEALGLDDYLQVINCPMDLGTVKAKLDSHQYLKSEDCAADIRLVWFVNMT